MPKICRFSSNLCVGGQWQENRALKQQFCNSAFVGCYPLMTIVRTATQTSCTHVGTDTKGSRPLAMVRMAAAMTASLHCISCCQSVRCAWSMWSLRDTGLGVPILWIPDGLGQYVSTYVLSPNTVVVPLGIRRNIRCLCKIFCGIYKCLKSLMAISAI